uniref:Uncharacterized protein n=1 Tax=Rhizophora mucronata TaxID=61149 RepID=A0A2P2PW00_RHIMU
MQSIHFYPSSQHAEQHITKFLLHIRSVYCLTFLRKKGRCS